MTEHDGCDGCIHESKDCHEEPCTGCKQNHTVGWYPDLWTDKDGQMTFIKPEDDAVNHPSHYCQDGGMECIDEMIAIFGKTAVQHFCLLNVWKYRKRAVFKNGVEDMQKADWYMKKYAELGGKVVKV